MAALLIFHLFLQNLGTCIYYKMYRTEDYSFDNSGMANRFCQIVNEIVLMIDYFYLDTMTETMYVCGRYVERVDDLFSIPCKSSYVDVIIIQLAENTAPVHCANVSEISGKYFCMPVDSHEHHQYVLSKLLHCEFLFNLLS